MKISQLHVPYFLICKGFTRRSTVFQLHLNDTTTYLSIIYFLAVSKVYVCDYFSTVAYLVLQDKAAPVCLITKFSICVLADPLLEVVDSRVGRRESCGTSQHTP